MLRNGADEVVYPIKEVAEKLAIRLSANNIFEYIEMSSDYSISEMPIHESWLGRSIADVDVRRRFNVNILGIKKNGQLVPMPSADYVFAKEDHVVLIGKMRIFFACLQKYKRNIKICKGRCNLHRPFFM